MELTQGRTVKIIGYMLIALAISQPIYTARRCQTNVAAAGSRC